MSDGEWSKRLPARNDEEVIVGTDRIGPFLRVASPGLVRLTVNQCGDIAHALLEAVRRAENAGGGDVVA